jgi:hypothetical protein
MKKPPADQWPRKKILATILVAGFLAGAGYGSVVSRRHLQQETLKIQEQLVRTRDRLERAVPAPATGTVKSREEVLRLLDIAAGRSNLRIESLRPRAEPDGSSLRVDLALQGTLPAFGDFLKTCSDLSAPPGVEDMSLSAREKGGLLIRLSLCFPVSAG